MAKMMVLQEAKPDGNGGYMPVEDGKRKIFDMSELVEGAPDTETIIENTINATAAKYAKEGADTVRVLKSPGGMWVLQVDDEYFAYLLIDDE